MTHIQMSQDAFFISSKSFLQNIKDFFKNLFIFLKKSCQVFQQLFLKKIALNTIYFWKKK